MTKRVFVFTEDQSNDKSTNRPLLWAIPEDQIEVVQSQSGSQNCYLVVNGRRVQGSFDKLVAALGERVDII